MHLKRTRSSRSGAAKLKTCLRSATVLNSASAATTPPVAGLTLRPYQLDALSAVEEAETRWLPSADSCRWRPGSGKPSCSREQIRRRGDRGIVLVHRDELVRQTVEKLSMVMPGVPVGVVKAERDDHGAQVVVASVQTLAPGRRGFSGSSRTSHDCG